MVEPDTIKHGMELLRVLDVRECHEKSLNSQMEDDTPASNTSPFCTALNEEILKSFLPTDKSQGETLKLKFNKIYLQMQCN